MINKEVILDSTGGIRKDFAKRGIPQYSNNYVHVNFLIPQDVFAELDNYTVQVAASITAQSQTTVLPTLYAFSSKTLKIDDINYIKYSVVLSSIYTEKRGALKLSPSVYEVREATVNSQLTTQLINRKAYVYTQLDVVESVDATYDNSLDNPSIAVALSNAIDSKHISDIDENGASIAEIAYNIVTDYSTPYYNGWILMNKAKKQMFIPYIGTNDEENLFYLDYKNGIMYDITEITSITGTPVTYSCNIKQINFSKEEVETLLSDKLEDVAYADNYFTKTYHNNVTNEDTTENIVHVDTLADDMGFTAHKNNTNNPHSVTKTQVGLGNVSNYTISNAYNSDSATSYASSKAVYDGLATKADLDALQTLQSTVNQLITILGDPEGEDADNIVNKLTEVIQVFSDYEESNGSIITLLNTKADVTTVSTLSGSVDALATRVSNIEEAGAGLIILKPEGANQALLTLTPSEFVANTGANALDYPYKTTLTSTAFVGAQDFSIVFDEEDGGLFESICTLNNQTGELTLYCSELPTQNIVIVKIRLIFSLASINSLILTQNSQIATNTANITDIYSQLNNKQNTSNLVTSWGSTTSDSKYPSEKLTKDTLDLKQNAADLAAVATSGSYGDLINTPTIPDAVIANPTLAGTESDLTGIQIGDVKYKTPTPQVQSNWNETDTTSPAYIQNKPNVVTTKELLTTSQSYTTCSQSTTSISISSPDSGDDELEIKISIKQGSSVLNPTTISFKTKKNQTGTNPAVYSSYSAYLWCASTLIECYALFNGTTLSIGFYVCVSIGSTPHDNIGDFDFKVLSVKELKNY